MRPLDALALVGFALAAAGAGLLYEREPSLAGAMLPLAALGCGAAVLMTRPARWP